MLTNAESQQTAPAEVTPEQKAIGQWNLFTGEVEPIPGPTEPDPQPETPWLFNPDFGLVLPDDPAGKKQVSGDRFQVSGRKQV